MTRTRTITSMFAIAAAAGAFVPAAGLASSPPETSVPAASEPAVTWSIQIDGAVSETLTLTADDLAGLDQQTQTVSFLSGSGYQTHIYEGPLLIDVLDLAAPAFDPDVKNDKLGHTIIVTASDGYVAAVAWGEIDPDFEGKPMLLATTEDGQPLTDGPRLTAPGDSHGGRYVSGVVSLTLVGAD